MVRPRALDHVAATTAPSAGPIMKIVSVTMESRAKAVCRSLPWVSTPSPCRTTEKIGSENTPPRNTARSIGQNGSHGTIGQITASAITEGSSARRSPFASTTRPRHGEPTAMPSVIAAPARPAWP